MVHFWSWCICSGFEQLRDMLSSVLQKTLRWSSRAAFFMTACATCPSNRSVVRIISSQDVSSHVLVWDHILQSSDQYGSGLYFRCRPYGWPRFAASMIASVIATLFDMFYVFNQGGSQSQFLSLFESLTPVGLYNHYTCEMSSVDTLLSWVSEWWSINQQESLLNKQGPGQSPAAKRFLALLDNSFGLWKTKLAIQRGPWPTGPPGYATDA